MNTKELSQSIRKNATQTNRKSTEAITIRLTKDEKKRIRRLANSCRMSVTQLIKTLVNGAKLHAIPPSEFYEIRDFLDSIRDEILLHLSRGEPIRAELDELETCMKTFTENCQRFYNTPAADIFGEAFDQSQSDFLAELDRQSRLFGDGEGA